MTTIYRRTIGYSKVCSCVQDYMIEIYDQVCMKF